MKVLDQLVFFGGLYGVTRARPARRARHWLARFRVPEYADRRAEQLSKGNQQKVQFIAAILHDPDVLIMDEPFSGLDPVNVALLKEAFLELRDRGKTVIFSTHQMEQVEELCDAIAIIDHGRLVASGPTRDVQALDRQAVVRLGDRRRPRPLLAGRDPGRRDECGPGSTTASSRSARRPTPRRSSGGPGPRRAGHPLRDRRPVDRGHLHRAGRGVRTGGAAARGWRPGAGGVRARGAPMCATSARSPVVSSSRERTAAAS